MEVLRYCEGAKLGARRVPRELRYVHKQAHFEVCLALIECHQCDKNILNAIVTDDET